MASGTSYNGWPANSDPGSIDIESNFSVDGMRFPGGVKGGDVATVYRHLIPDLVKIDPPSSKEYNVEGFWGYSYKPNTNNPSVLSCHASGTAIDWRAVAHPNKQGTSYIGWSSKQIAAVQRLLAEKYNNLVKWLSYDSMHFEIGGTPGQIKVLAAKLGGANPDNGGEDDDLTDDDIQKIAKAVWAYMAPSHGKPVDGKEKPVTISVAQTLADAATYASRAAAK